MGRSRRQTVAVGSPASWEEKKGASSRGRAQTEVERADARARVGSSLQQNVGGEEKRRTKTAKSRRSRAGEGAAAGRGVGKSRAGEGARRSAPRGKDRAGKGSVAERGRTEGGADKRSAVEETGEAGEGEDPGRQGRGGGPARVPSDVAKRGSAEASGKGEE